MGSRAVVVVCRDGAVARERFGVLDGSIGIVYTRTGRRFLDDDAMEAALLDRVRGACEASGLWDALESGWVCLDCELMPWSMKAQALLREQYAAVGSAARGALAATAREIDAASERLGQDMDVLRAWQHARQESVDKYTEAYRGYCWEVGSIEDVRLAPFHILASEGSVHADKDHVWHMSTIVRMAEADPILVATPYRVVDLTDEASTADAVRWWEELTAAGGEGMVVKPRSFWVRGTQGLMQPAVKCRGPEYLRIIYGPEYLMAENLRRLRSRGLKHKRSLALREFALGIESLERFVRREPLRRVHECVFGVLALESEPVDPRL